MKDSVIYALDFDGVICDSAVETGITGWKAARKLYSDMPEEMPAQDLIDQFRLARPIIETGYESILVMRLLFEGENIDTILADFTHKKQALLNRHNIDNNHLIKLFGDTRDQWIENSLDEWVNMNPLFGEVQQKLQNLNHWYIITTKQERFVRKILKANQINMADENIFGLDRQLSKEQVLAVLLNKHPDKAIYFVEDRLPTLKNVIKNKQLSSIKLFFALWGYNTDEDKAQAAQMPVESIQLDNFLI